MVHQAPLAVGHPLPRMRIDERPDRLPSQDHALPAPGDGLRQEVQRQDGTVMEASKVGSQEWLTAMVLRPAAVRGRHG